MMTNLHLDFPANGTLNGSENYFQWFHYKSGRFVFIQQQVGKLAMIGLEFPPMRKGRA
jgi:arylsulfatase